MKYLPSIITFLAGMLLFIYPEVAQPYCPYIVFGGLLLILIIVSVIWLPYLIEYKIIARNEKLKNLYFKFCKIKTDKNDDIKLTFFSACIMDDALEYLQNHPGSDILLLASFLQEKYSISAENFCLIIKKLKDSGCITLNY